MKCGMCDSTNTELFLDLGYIPIVDNFLTKDMLNETKALYPLNVHVCKDCGLSQLGYIVPANKLFNENYNGKIIINLNSIYYFREVTCIACLNS